MTKEQSTIIKGVAILMMLWGHLFVDPQLVENLHTLLPNIGNIPFATWIKKGMPPVPFFLMLSGYGMYIVNSKVDGDKNRFNRILHLLFISWLVIFIFVPIGHILKPEEYPGSMVKFLGNISGIDPSYNTALWFLLPYVLLAISARLLIKVLNKINIYLQLGGAYCLSTAVSWWISKHTVFLNDNRLVYILLEYFALMAPFVYGIIAARYSVFNRIRSFVDKRTHLNVMALPALLIIFISQCAIPSSLLTSIYVFSFIALFNELRLPAAIRFLLRYLGKYSMTMWMVHSYFYSYLFHDFIYSFNTPLLIFLVLVVVSLITSVIIQNVGNILYDKLYSCVRKSQLAS